MIDAAAAGTPWLGSAESTTVDGSGAALEAYESHGRAIYSFLLGATRDAAVAEDLTQETFLRFVREASAGRLPDNVRGWLVRVAANLATSRGRRLQTADRMKGALVSVDVGRSAEDEVVRRERVSALQAALDDLSVTDRSALLLAARGYPGPEIAVLLGRSEGATRTILCRARVRLRRRLEMESEESRDLAV